ncbi:MAG TPA: hypothetical protein VF178_07195 [Gemmatimonadaceae bacterium]
MATIDFATHETVLGELRGAFPTAVLDGPVDTASYEAAPVRILWILREVYGDGTPWDLRGFLGDREKLFSYPRWHATYGLVAKVSHGLLHAIPPAGFHQLSAREAAQALDSIAVINLNKLGGGAQVNWPTFLERVRQFETFAARQVKALAPEMVIAAGTFDVLPATIRSSLQHAETGGHSYSHATMPFLVRAHHPGQRRMRHDTYYGNIASQLEQAGWTGIRARRSRPPEG